MDSHIPVEKVIVDLDLGASLKVIWQQHHRGRHLAELIDLISQNKNGKARSARGHLSPFLENIGKFYLVLRTNDLLG